VPKVSISARIAGWILVFRFSDNEGAAGILKNKVLKLRWSGKSQFSNPDNRVEFFPRRCKMEILDDLVSIIDNGGQRSHVSRRSKGWLFFFPERRSKAERRKIEDRRKVQNKERNDGPERRQILKKNQKKFTFKF
jgi:hypothetical protein